MQLSKVQIQDVLTNLVNKDNGLNEVLGLMPTPRFVAHETESNHHQKL